MTGKRSRNMGALALGLAAAFVLSVPADARRGGSFGSRGARTFDAPAATNVAPRPAAPVQRSMTPRPAAQRPQATAPAGQSRARSFAGPLIGGLLMGGLIGALLGGGLGSLGGSGLLVALLQIAVIGGLVWLAFRLFRRRPAVAGGPQAGASNAFSGLSPNTAPAPAGGAAPFGGFGGGAAPVAPQERDIAIDDADRETFERLLIDVQAAFGREDYSALRSLTTPEVMSFFAEELGQNATSGRRNQVSGTRLIDAEVAEAWAEGGTDYATIAMRYESIDVMVDRTSGAVIEGDADRPNVTTEVWTFARANGGGWRLSAIQEA